jgi:hypothetical protein
MFLPLAEKNLAFDLALRLPRSLMGLYQQNLDESEYVLVRKFSVDRFDDWAVLTGP